MTFRTLSGTSLILGFALLVGCAGTTAPTEVPTQTDGAAVAAEEAEAEKAEPAAVTTEVPVRGDDTERKSKNGHLVHSIGGVSIDARFGRPEVRGRTVWGELVPMGKIWRTGADEATTVAFDKDVTVNGEALGAGVYSLFTIPAEGEWTVVFNTVPKQWGAYDYDESKDALRVTATPGEGEAVEAMNIEGTETGFTIRWEKVAVPVTIAPAAAPAEEKAAEPAATEGAASE